MSRRRIEANELSIQGVSHGFFTRLGGISNGTYSSLNCGFGSDDEQSNVAHNRSIVADTLGLPGGCISTPYQTHSSDVVIADKDWEHIDAPKADAIVTNTPKVIIGVLSADCAPVLFVDQVNKVVAAAHAGWRGAVGGVLENTIESMRSLGAQRRHIVAVVGPCIGLDNYEVGDEFLDHFLSIDPNYNKYFQKTNGSLKHHFNLTDFALGRLKKTGIKSASTTNNCTYEDESHFFSFRRNGHNSVADYGRQISAIVIN